MYDKIRKLLAAMAVGVLVSVGGAAPAQANTIFGCSDTSLGSLGTVCIFDGTQFGKGHWHQWDISYIINSNDGGVSGCAQFPSDHINTTSSFVINPGSNGASLGGLKFYFYPNNYCVGTPVPWYWADQEDYDGDLRDTCCWGNVSNVWNSVRIYG